MGGNALAHGADELRRRPAADTIGLIRRYIRHVEGAKSGRQRETAAKASLILLGRRSVAGAAATGIEQQLAVREIWRIRVGDITRRVQSRPGKRCGQDQIASKTEHAQQSGQDY